MNLVIVTGFSGSGKSIALNVLEDLNHYCIDNLPVALLTSFTEQILGEWGKDKAKIAVGIDARSNEYGLNELPLCLEKLRKRGIVYTIFFLHSDENTLLQRFHLTRRKHPLSSDSTSLIEALTLEKKLLKPLMQQANYLIDTSRTNIHQLRDVIQGYLSPDQHEKMSVQLQSFGFKYGVPIDVDLVFDARCLPNPHWELELRNLTGFDQGVIAFLEKHDEVQLMEKNLVDFLTTWMPKYAKTNRKYLSIAIGCTGGQHRSVYLVNAIEKYLKLEHKNIIVRHRELS